MSSLARPDFSSVPPGAASTVMDLDERAVHLEKENFDLKQQLHALRQRQHVSSGVGLDSEAEELRQLLGEKNAELEQRHL